MMMTMMMMMSIAIKSVPIKIWSNNIVCESIKVFINKSYSFSFSSSVNTEYRKNIQLSFLFTEWEFSGHSFNTCHKNTHNLQFTLNCFSLITAFWIFFRSRLTMAQYFSIGRSSGVLGGCLFLGTTWTLLAAYDSMAFFHKGKMPNPAKTERNNCVASGKAVDVFVGTRSYKFPGWRFRSQCKCCSSSHRYRWPATTDISSRTSTVQCAWKYLPPFPVRLPYKIPAQEAV